MNSSFAQVTKGEEEGAQYACEGAMKGRKELRMRVVYFVPQKISWTEESRICQHIDEELLILLTITGTSHESTL